MADSENDDIQSLYVFTWSNLLQGQSPWSNLRIHTIPDCRVWTYNHLDTRPGISLIFRGNKAAGVLVCIVQNYLIYQMLLSVNLLHVQSLWCNLRLRVLHKGTVHRLSLVGLGHTTFWLPSQMFVGLQGKQCYRGISLHCSVLLSHLSDAFISALYSDSPPGVTSG